MNEAARDLFGMSALEDDYNEDCPECGGEGFVLNDCFEDTCCCADPESEHGFSSCSICNPRASAVVRP